MYNNQRIVCVILARGGSSRLPGKNIKPFLGKPLIAYAIEAAKGSLHIDRVIVSTDDEAIAAIAKEYAAEVPFIRPSDLATDTATSLAALQHAVNTIEGSGEKVDYVVLIQPTVPGIQTSDVSAAVEKCIDAEAKSCITVSEIVDPPAWMYRMSDDGRIVPYMDAATARNQDLEKLYRINGAVYVTMRDTLMKENKIVDNSSAVAVVMPRERSTDIDTAIDFAIAETLLKQ